MRVFESAVLPLMPSTEEEARWLVRDAMGPEVMDWLNEEVGEKPTPTHAMVFGDMLVVSPYFHSILTQRKEY